MAKTAILSNGNLNIGLNEFGLVSDFYFPDNGYENHTLGCDLFHRVGIKIGNNFSWLHSGGWQFSVEYFENALISKTEAINQELQIKITFTDFVASDFDVFGRKIQVQNLANYPREIQLFLHQNFAINSSFHLADTVQFLPFENNEKAILHYRGKRAFIISAQRVFQKPLQNIFEDFNQHTVGLFGIENKLGSWVDAEDGALSGSNVEHGQTDSVVGFDFSLGVFENANFQYSISCADGHELARTNLQKVRNNGFSKALDETKKYWQKWLSPALRVSKKLDSKYQKSFIQSLMLVKSHLAKTGAPIASNDSEMLNYARDDYSYCWPRDALFAIWPLIRIGYRNEPQKFFEFCKRSLTSGGFMMHKYLPNGELGPSWHPYSQGGDTRNLPIQIDETAGILFLFAQYYKKFRENSILNEFYDDLVKPTANFLVDFCGENDLPKPNYELWEMDFLSTTYSTSVVFAALYSASKLAQAANRVHDAKKWREQALKIRSTAQDELFNEESNYFYRGIWADGNKDPKIDLSSFYGAFMFNLFEFKGEKLQTAFKTLENRFKANDNIGLPRFENDIYYRFSDDYEANIWPITTLWRAEFYIALGEISKAEEITEWVLKQQTLTGILPEQINPRDLKHLSVAPLTWSQAEYVSALLDLVAFEEE